MIARVAERPMLGLEWTPWRLCLLDVSVIFFTENGRVWKWGYREQCGGEEDDVLVLYANCVETNAPWSMACGEPFLQIQRGNTRGKPVHVACNTNSTCINYFAGIQM